MSKKINDLRSQYDLLKKFADKGMYKGQIKDFEQYYGGLQDGGSMKSIYIPLQHENLERFIESMMFTNDEKKSGKLNDEEAQDFEELLNTIQQEEKSFLKKLMRTMLLDMYDSMAGDLDRDNTSARKKYLDQAIALTDLYDRVLNEKDKEELKNAFSNGEAGNFLTNTDHEMDGNFSKSLKSLYEEYRKPEQTEAEKAKWKKLCNSYAVRPYMKAVSEKVKKDEKQRAYDALPEAEKALRKESKELKQDPDQFVNMSPDERNKIRQAVAANRLEEMRQQPHPYQQGISELKQELRAKADHNTWTHRYFVNKPERLDRKAADLQLSEKDSVEFRRMFGSLTKLRNTVGYRDMDTLVAEGEEKDLVNNLNQAIRYTQEYIAYADQKSFMKMGFTGRKRLNAARDILGELTNLSDAIQEERKALRDFRNNKVRLEELEQLENERPKAETSSKSVKEIISQMNNPERNGHKIDATEQRPRNGWKVPNEDQKLGIKMNVEELNIKFNGKKQEWVKTDFIEKQNANVQKQTDKGLSK